MTVLAIVSGAELGFVVLHHLARVIMVLIAAPIFFRTTAKETLS